MTRLVALLACLCVTLGFAAVAPAADAAGAKKPSAAKKKKVVRVCFKRTVRTSTGRKVRKTVCRPRRKVVARPRVPAARPVVAPSGPVIDPAAPIAAPSAPAATAPVAPACIAEDTDRLLATARDLNGKFVLSLTRLCLRSGRTIVQLRNEDLQNHDLWAEGTAPAHAQREVIAAAEPTTTEEAEMQLTAGTWRLFCSIEGHENMSRTVTVVD